jgi:hypothetical protein
MLETVSASIKKCDEIKDLYFTTSTIKGKRDNKNQII